MVTICPQSSSSPLPFMISSARAGKNRTRTTSRSVRYLSLSLPPWRPAGKQKPPSQCQAYLPAPRNSLSIEMVIVILWCPSAQYPATHLHNFASLLSLGRGSSFSVWCLSFLYPCSPPLFNVVLASIEAGCAGVWVPDPRRRFDLVIDIVVSLHPSVSTSQEDTENERQKQRTSLVFGSH